MNLLIFSTNSKSITGGVAAAVNNFAKMLTQNDVEYSLIPTHIENSRAKSVILFFIAIIKLFLHKFSNKAASTALLHVSPRGSLLRKWILSELCNVLSIPFAIQIHSADFEAIILDPYSIQHKLLKRICRLSRVNFALTTWWKIFFESNGIQNVRILPNVIFPTPTFIQPGIQPTLMKPSERIIFTAARIEKGKNIDLIIRSLQYLPTEFALLVAGSGPHLQALVDLTRTLSLTDRVKFLGWIQHQTLNEYFKIADVFALPTQHDSFGMIFLEALRADCPVVFAPSPIIQASIGGISAAICSASYNEPEIAEAIKKASLLKGTTFSHEVQQLYGPGVVFNMLRSHLPSIKVSALPCQK